MTTSQTTNESSFGKSFSELEKIVQGFELNITDPEEGLKKFEQAILLARDLKARLRKIENRVETIKKKFSFDLEEETDKIDSEKLETNDEMDKIHPNR